MRKVVRWCRRVAFRLAEIFVPNTMARLAAERSMRIRSSPPLAHRARGGQAGEPLSIAVAGRPLSAFSFGDGPVVLLVHGWEGWWQQLGGFVQPLVDDGFRVVVWDNPSHGSSGPGVFGPGRSGMIDFCDSLMAVADHFQDQVAAVITHSAGCLALGSALSTGFSTQRAVLLAPTIRLRDAMMPLIQRLGWGPRTLARYWHWLSLAQRRPIEDFDLIAMIRSRELPLPETLLVYDEDDAGSPQENVDTLLEMWPGLHPLMTAHAGHHSLLRSREVIDGVVNFVKSGVVPKGA